MSARWIARFNGHDANQKASYRVWDTKAGVAYGVTSETPRGTLFATYMEAQALASVLNLTMAP